MIKESENLKSENYPSTLPHPSIFQSYPPSTKFTAFRINMATIMLMAFKNPGLSSKPGRSFKINLSSTMVAKSSPKKCLYLVYWSIKHYSSRNIRTSCKISHHPSPHNMRIIAHLNWLICVRSFHPSKIGILCLGCQITIWNMEIKYSTIQKVKLQVNKGYQLIIWWTINSYQTVR